MAVTRPFSDSYLLEYSGEHLLYEFYMLIRCAEFLANQHEHIQCAVDDTQTIRNVLVESYAIHLRNLVAFFYGESNRPLPTDVFAVDFLESGEWQRLRPPKSETLKKAEQRAHKQIAHLTTERYAGVHEEKAWNIISLTKEIKDITRIFIGAASTSRLAPNIQPT